MSVNCRKCTCWKACFLLDIHTTFPNSHPTHAVKMRPLCCCPVQLVHSLCESQSHSMTCTLWLSSETSVTHLDNCMCISLSSYQHTKACKHMHASTQCPTSINHTHLPSKPNECNRCSMVPRSVSEMQTQGMAINLIPIYKKGIYVQGFDQSDLTLVSCIYTVYTN